MLDVDGVLVTGRPRDGSLWYSGLQTDLDIDPNWLRSEFFAKDWSDIVVGRADLLPRLQACLNQLDRKFPAQDLIDYWFKMDSRIDMAILADCKQLRAQGVNIYLATNQEHCRAHFLMNNMGLAAYVDGIIYSAQVGFSKPTTQFYKAAEETSGQLPSNIMLVDDALPNIIAAQQAGWKATHWTGAISLIQIFEAHALSTPNA
jgi:putative hydrolase of the HAD superfamily